jgi:hypothetical protein
VCEERREYKEKGMRGKVRERGGETLKERRGERRGGTSYMPLFHEPTYSSCIQSYYTVPLHSNCIFNPVYMSCT